MCDAIVQENEKILSVSQKLEKNFPDFTPKEVNEMEIFCKIVAENCPKFTASRFFVIQRTNLLYILSTIVTFFIVLIEFNSQKN